MSLNSPAAVPALPPLVFDRLIEEWLDRLVPAADAQPQPLHRAMRHAVFSGGKRLRPQLLLQVAVACGSGDDELELALRAACAVELVHTASLVHDDLPCFDDAAVRRGRPTVHVLYGEPTAVLVGDALLTLAFAILADAPAQAAARAMRLMRLLARATGSSSGLIGGQSLEQHPDTSAGFSIELIERYHAMKTGALFRLAAEAGAVAAGAVDAAAWARVGELIGAWYQLADDLLDVRAAADAVGKPVARDADLGRPNAVLCGGEAGVTARMGALRSAIRTGIARLAVYPESLLVTIDDLHRHVLRAIGTAP